jgi:hypothetical protein
MSTPSSAPPADGPEHWTFAGRGAAVAPSVAVSGAGAAHAASSIATDSPAIDAGHARNIHDSLGKDAAACYATASLSLEFTKSGTLSESSG